MKQLINPPLNLVLTLLGLGLLALTVWNVLNIKLMSEDTQSADAYSKIEIPSAETLAAPPLRQYTAMLDAPLFWEGREKFIPPKIVKKEVKKEELSLTDKKLPEGRLIGIVDTGESMMVVFKDEKNSHYLRLNDKWGSWKVTGIGHDAIELALGGETQRLELISDYTAPAANKNQLAQQRKNQNTSRNNGRNRLAELRRPNLPNNVKNLPHLASTQKQAPPTAIPAEMTIKEALAARQRLMAARWKKK